MKQKLSGLFPVLLMNKNITERIWVGKRKHSKDKVENISWTNKSIKSLGIYFGHKIECEQLNWGKRLRK